MCEFNDSLTEIDWLHSLCIKTPTNCKEEKQTEIEITKHVEITNDEPSNIKNCCGYEKPSYSYAYLIKLAIENSPEKRLKLNEIYAWIINQFPYYRHVHSDNNKGWKNAIRHNLSLNKTFKRCPKDKSHLGKGSYWTIDPNCDENSIQCPPVKKLRLSIPSSTMYNPKINNSNQTSPVYSISPNTPSNDCNMNINSFKHINLENTPPTPNADSPSSTKVNSTSSGAISLIYTLITNQTPIGDLIQNIDKCSTQLLSQMDSNNLITFVMPKSFDNKLTNPSPVSAMNQCPLLSSSSTTSSSPSCSSILISNESNVPRQSQYFDKSAFLQCNNQLYYNSNNAFDNLSKLTSLDQNKDPVSMVTTPVHRDDPIDTCEYSYSQSYSWLDSLCSLSKMSPIVHSKINVNQLEVDENCEPYDNNPNVNISSNKNPLLKTPVLSQITSEDHDFCNSKIQSDNEQCCIDNTIVNNSILRTGESTGGIDSFNFQDSFVSLQQSLFESESYSRLGFTFQRITNDEAEKSENSSNSSVSPQFKRVKLSSGPESQQKRNSQDSCLDASLGLSHNTKAFLLNLSGMPDNLQINQNHQAQVQDLSSLSRTRNYNKSYDISTPILTTNQNDSIINLSMGSVLLPKPTTDNLNGQSSLQPNDPIAVELNNAYVDDEESSATKAFLEMKNSLKQYRYKTLSTSSSEPICNNNTFNDMLSSVFNQSLDRFDDNTPQVPSDSTPSTEKSSDTICELLMTCPTSFSSCKDLYNNSCSSKTRDHKIGTTEHLVHINSDVNNNNNNNNNTTTATNNNNNNNNNKNNYNKQKIQRKKDEEIIDHFNWETIV